MVGLERAFSPSFSLCVMGVFGITWACLLNSLPLRQWRFVIALLNILNTQNNLNCFPKKVILFVTGLLEAASLRCWTSYIISMSSSCI